MTKREKRQLRSALYSLAHTIAGAIIMAALVLLLPFLFAIRYAYLERRENGEWFPCHAQTGHFLDMTSEQNSNHPAYCGKR